MKQSQKARLLAALREGPVCSFRFYGDVPGEGLGPRIAARVYDLRRDGHVIESRPCTLHDHTATAVIYELAVDAGQVKALDLEAKAQTPPSPSPSAIPATVPTPHQAWVVAGRVYHAPKAKRRRTSSGQMMTVCFHDRFQVEACGLCEYEAPRIAGPLRLLQ